MPLERIRLSFYLMMGNTSTYSSWVCSYVRVTEGKLVFQSAADYQMRSFSLTRVHDVEMKPCKL